VAATILVAMAMARRSPTHGGMSTADVNVRMGPGSNGERSSGAPTFTLPAVAAIVVLAPTVLYLTMWNSEPVPLQRGFSNFPMEIAGFSGERIGQLGAPFRRGVAQEEFVARYVNGTGQTAKVFVGYFPLQNEQQELIDYRFNWLHDAAQPVDVPTSPATRMKMTRIMVGGRPASTYFYYYVNGRQLIDPHKVKLASLVDALAKGQTNGAIVVVLFERPGGDTLSAEQQAFLREVVSAAGAILPGHDGDVARP